MLPKKHKVLFLSISLVSTLLTFSFTPIKSLCGDQLKDIAVIPYVSVNKVLSDDLTQKDTSANQLIADTLVKRFRYWSGLPVVVLQGVDKNSAWQINREIANTFLKAVKLKGGTAKPNKEFFAQAKIPPHLKSVLVRSQAKYAAILVFDALYHQADYQEDLNQKAINRSITWTLVKHLTSPLPLPFNLHIEIPMKGMNMMQTIIYDVEKDKVVFLSAEYYKGRIEMRKMIKHFDQQYYLFFD